ncbi:MAG: anion permease [Chloroflexi bacterium HGW-Chloroflexi-4]|jgi:PiT family inorganic phosphate transporter|nr:MAG: anion permease [Chloroflexi bacterium HGW-Chloroflexi-4]
MPILLIVLIALAIIFDFLNGVHDSSNIVATMISSRAIQPRLALAMTAIAEFCGPFIFGVAVANTIGHEIVSSENLNMIVIIAALVSAIVWNVMTWLLGIPSSSSHALIGGIIGAVAIGAGFQEIHLAGVLKVVLTLFISPVLGFVVGIFIANVIYTASANATPKVNTLFKRLQVVTSLGLALSHGTNDAQKTMGIITLGLVISGVQETFSVPFWVIVVCALTIALGTSVGGWQLIRTLGSKFYKIRPVHGFAAQATSAAVILTASLLGGPVSTTQVVSTAIMGVGAAERMSKVRWGVAGEIASAWLFTIPSTALLAAGIYWIITVGVPAIIKLF